MSDLVTVWNGTIERAWTRAQQRPPEAVPERPPSSTPAADVLAYLAQHPGSTVQHVAEGTGREWAQVNGALHALLAMGRVTRSDRPDDGEARWSNFPRG